MLDESLGSTRDMAFRLLMAVAFSAATIQMTNCGDSLGSPTTHPAVGSPDALSAPVGARYVKLEVLSEVDGHSWTSMAEFNLIDGNGATLGRQGWKAQADSASANDAAALAIDGNPNTMWHTRWEADAAPMPHHFIVDLGRTASISGFRYLPRQDLVPNGTVARYRLYASQDGTRWGAPVAEGDLAAQGDPAGEKTVVFALQTPNHAPVLELPPTLSSRVGEQIRLRLAAHDDDDDALTYTGANLPPGLDVDAASGIVSGTPIRPGRYAATLTATDGKGLDSAVQVTWTVLGAASAAPERPLARGEARYVKLEELSEVDGHPWASLAEFELVDAAGKPLPRTGWVAIADSAELDDLASHAIDGDATTIWHSRWRGEAKAPPHALIVDLGRIVSPAGFRVTPRQDGVRNGTIARYRFYFSADGQEWGAPVHEGVLFSGSGAMQSKTTYFR